MPAVHGVVRWRACELIMRLHGGNRCAAMALATFRIRCCKCLLVNPNFSDRLLATLHRA